MNYHYKEQESTVEIEDELLDNIQLFRYEHLKVNRVLTSPAKTDKY